MQHFRIIPCLLLKGQGLVKGRRFRDHDYVGDPINAIKIYNDQGADELIVLDIEATRSKAGPNFDRIGDLATECFMPLCYGGGIRNLDHVIKIHSLGVEKTAINTAAIESPDLIDQAASAVGSQSIVAVIDYKRTWFRGYRVASRCGSKLSNSSPVEFAQELERRGAGEIILNSIDRDGLQSGYDLPTIAEVAQAVSIPVVALGGCGKIDDLIAAKRAGASAAAAGSLFVYYGRLRAVLVNYPISETLREREFYADSKSSNLAEKGNQQ